VEAVKCGGQVHKNVFQYGAHIQDLEIQMALVQYVHLEKYLHATVVILFINHHLVKFIYMVQDVDLDTHVLMDEEEEVLDEEVWEEEEEEVWEEEEEEEVWEEEEEEEEEVWEEEEEEVWDVTEVIIS
jgi:hypothetical protein